MSYEQQSLSRDEAIADCREQIGDDGIGAVLIGSPCDLLLQGRLYGQTKRGVTLEHLGTATEAEQAEGVSYNAFNYVDARFDTLRTEMHFMFIILVGIIIVGWLFGAHAVLKGKRK